MDDPLAALPSILAGLEDGGAPQEAAALELAQLVDAAAGEDSLRLGAALGALARSSCSPSCSPLARR